MKLEQQVISLEISKRLKELGVKQDSLYYWWIYGSGEAEIISESNSYDKDHAINNRFSAFTVAELGEMLPNEIETYKRDQWNIRLNDKGQFIVADTEADARGKMLIYLLENKLM